MNTLNVQLFDLTTLLFGGASGTYIAAMYGKKETLARIGTWICVAAAVVSTAALGVRWAESYKMGIGRIPVTNLYESLVFFAWSVNLFYLFVEWKYKSRAFGAFVMPIAFATMLFAFTNESGIQPLVPALQSYWLHAHVITCFISYASFALSCAMSIIYLVKLREKEKGQQGTRLTTLFPSLDSLDGLVYKTIVVGFPLLTLGIVTGAAWANYAWGSYWSWDPKETWSLITWFVYAIFLHARFAREWRGKRTALLSIIGFAAVIFTYFGVNYVLSGLHSYA